MKDRVQIFFVIDFLRTSRSREINDEKINVLCTENISLQNLDSKSKINEYVKNRFIVTSFLASLKVIKLFL